jgi:quercetin dioxygenase-like cupin family protein
MKITTMAFAAVLFSIAPLAAQEAGSRPSGPAGVPDAVAAGWKGQKICENLHEDAHIRVLRCILPPNAGHERHSHPPVFGYVLSGGRGRNTNANGTEDYEVETGETYTNDAIEWHEGLNIGETPLGFLIIEKKY